MKHTIKQSKKEKMERILKFEKLEQREMNAINSCLADLFNYHQTCAAPEDFRNLRIFAELVRAEAVSPSILQSI